MSRVGLDIRGTFPGFRAHFGRGTGRYAAELARHLVGKHSDPGSSEVLQVDGLGPDVLAGHPWESALLKLIPAGRQTAHTQWILPRQLGRLPYDLLHFVHHGDATAKCPLPYCVTVLDLIPLRFPELYKPKRNSWRFRLARKLELDSIRNSQGIFAISEATKQDLIDILGIPPERIVVTPLGVDKKFKPRSENWREESKALREEFALPQGRELLFYYGGIDPRKNVPFLIDVMQGLLSEPAQSRPILVIAGAYEKDERLPALRRAIESGGLSQDVFLPGFVPEEKLLAFLAASDILLFPSLYEGFGLPVLEAMACGTPVLAGRNSSIREVMGRDEFLVPDADRLAWQQATRLLLSRPEVAEERVRWGFGRVECFPWEKTAETTLEGYRQFLKIPQSMRVGDMLKRQGNSKL